MIDELPMTAVYTNDSELGELHNLALRVAPESESAGLRLFRHEDDWPIGQRTAAYCIVGRHIAIRNTLRARGEWPGSWGAFIIFVERPSEGLLLHELSHRLPAEPPIVDDIEPTPQHVAEEIAYLSKDKEPDPADRFAGPWESHGADFIRRALHLHWRAWELGCEVALPDLRIAGPTYSLAAGWRYKHALGDEAERMAGATFAEIEAVPYPEEFLTLWRDDVARYYRQLAKKK